MKNLLMLVLISILFLSCSREIEKSSKLQDFIDVDINANYKGYFDKLSKDYLEILKLQYKTTDSNIILDSIVTFRKNINDSIKAGKILVKNQIVDSFQTSIPKIKIIKYRNSIYDLRFKSELFKEKIVLQTIEENEKKFIPYNPKSTPKIDSILSTKYSHSLLKEIQRKLEFKEYYDNSETFKKTDQKFKEYITLFKNDNLELLEFIYPPILESLLKSENQTEFTLEQKKELLNYLKKGKNSQELNFKRFLIDSFSKVNCSTEKEAYLLDYAIDVENNLYIPGKLIVIIENNNIYFIEADLEELKPNFSNIFSSDFLNCIEKLTKE